MFVIQATLKIHIYLLKYLVLPLNQSINQDAVPGLTSVGDSTNGLYKHCIGLIGHKY